MIRTLYKYDFTALSLPRTSSRINAQYKRQLPHQGLKVSSSRISQILLQYATQLYAVSNERRSIAQTEAWTFISRQLEQMEWEKEFIRKEDKKELLRLFSLMKKVYKQIPSDEIISVSVNQGMSTPWNRYYEEERLFLFGWEIARNGIPVAFDFFHHLFCQSVLIDKNNFSSVRLSLSRMEKTQGFERVRQRYKIDVSLHFKLYFLFTASGYLRRYLAEPECSPAARRLVKVWTDAAEDFLVKNRQQQNR